MSNHLHKIFDAWDGNAEAMAADIGELGVTVRQWRNRGDIPSRAWPKIIKLAADRGAVLRLEDFLRPEVVSELPPHAVGDTTEWPVAASNNGAGIIGDQFPGSTAGNSIGAEAEADSLRPFPEAAGTSPTSSRTCPLCAEPATDPHQLLSSTGEVEAA